METIRNYLETMFAKLPSTLEVQKAKDELWQMMEDKYTELIGDGRNENEAVGIVISEFGNLDELAEELGIKNIVIQESKGVDSNIRTVAITEVKDYLHDKTRSAYTIALGVFLCIVSCSGYLVNLGGSWRARGVFGISFMFLSIAAAVGLFLFSGFVMGKWKFLKEQACSIDFATAEYVHNQRELSRDARDDDHDRCHSVYTECAASRHFRQSVWMEPRLWCSGNVCACRDWCVSVCGGRECERRVYDNSFAK